MRNRKETEFNQTKSKREFDKMMADMQHDIEQRTHWKAQKYFWFGTVLAGIIAICVNGYLQFEVMKMQHAATIASIENK